MPTPDPGFQYYLARQSCVPVIETTEDGWAWITSDETHVLTNFGSVHVAVHDNIVVGES